MIKLNKFFAVVFINLMLISAFCSCSVNALDYVPVATVYTDAGALLTRFSVWALSGEVSADGANFGASCSPALTHYSEYEYYAFVLYAKDNPIVEISVPDTYAGIDVELWDGSAYVLRTGNASFTLSVPCNFNSSSVPPADWGTMPLAQPSGYAGSLRRVILAVNNTALGVDEAKLRITTYYATSPAVGFDGRNDYVKFDSRNITVFNFELLVRPFAVITGDTNRYVLSKAGVVEVRVPSSGFAGQGFKIYNATSAHNAYNTTDVYVNRILNYTGVFDGATVDYYLNGSKVSTAFVGTVKANTNYFSLGAYLDSLFFKGIIYSLNVVDSTAFLTLNASSFSGSSNTTVVDFSGAGNNGIAYGGVQYKVNLIAGYQLTYITLVASINVNETVINWYGEMEVLAALAVVLAFFIITLFAYYKMQNSTMVLLSAVFALMVNVLSLSSGIPFSPFPQLFLSIVELMLLVYARRMNI